MAAQNAERVADLVARIRGTAAKLRADELRNHPRIEEDRGILIGKIYQGGGNRIHVTRTTERAAGFELRVWRSGYGGEGYPLKGVGLTIPDHALVETVEVLGVALELMLALGREREDPR